MTKTPTHAAWSSRNLLQTLLDVPSLPVYVQQMPAVTLSRLIDRIGLEDSGELLEIIGPEQMNEVLSVSLWRRPAPGQMEVLDIEIFLRWVRTWLLEGEETMARRLLEMQEDLLVSLATPLFLVRTWDDEDLPGGVEFIFDEYRIYRRSESHWPLIEEMLLALWQYQPDFILRILARCDREQAAAGQNLPGIANKSSLYEDIAFEREDRRTHAGYVDPVHASVFLASASSRSLAELRDQHTYDYGTMEYFSRQAQRLTRLSSPTSSAAQDIAPSYQIANSGNRTKGKNETSSADMVSVGEISKEFEKLDATLRHAGVILSPTGPFALLAAPDSHTGASDSSTSTLLEQAFIKLARDAPIASSRRLSELAYVSNIVMIEMRVQGHGFSESDAARFAVSTANLGACWLLDNITDSDDSPSSVQRMLENEPGIVRLFQIGYRLLCDIPEQCARALENVPLSHPGDDTDFTHDEVYGMSRANTLASLIRRKQFDLARSRIDDLIGVIDSVECVALKTLIDSTPCFPCQLDSINGKPLIYVNKASRYISTLVDLHHITEFLMGLPTLSQG